MKKCGSNFVSHLNLQNDVTFTPGGHTSRMDSNCTHPVIKGGKYLESLSLDP